MGGDGRVGPDGGEVRVVSQDQPVEDHPLDDGVEQEVDEADKGGQAEQDQQTWKERRNMELTNILLCSVVG